MFYPSLLISISDASDDHLQTFSGFRSIPNNPDFLKLEPLEDKRSISIEQIHSLQASLGLKPYQENRRLVVVVPADRLTLPAQQALLKTLEEPPARIQMILATDRSHVLLPTVRSRLQTLSDIKKPELKKTPETLDELLHRCHSVSGAIELAEEWGTDKETAISHLQSLTVFLHQNKYDANSSFHLKILRHALQTLKHIESNINTKLALESFFLKLIKLV